jgi:hypothetical protein
VELSELFVYTKECTIIRWVILKISLKHYQKTYKNWLIRKYMVVLKCGVYNIGHWLLMLHNWKNIEDGY